MPTVTRKPAGMSLGDYIASQREPSIPQIGMTGSQNLQDVFQDIYNEQNEIQQEQSNLRTTRSMENQESSLERALASMVEQRRQREQFRLPIDLEQQRARIEREQQQQIRVRLDMLRNQFQLERARNQRARQTMIEQAQQARYGYQTNRSFGPNVARSLFFSAI